MKKWIATLVLTIFAFFAGFFIRQPKVNKLKKQIELLQKNENILLEMNTKQKEDFKEIYIQLQMLKLHKYKEKAKCKESLKNNLIEQYSLKEYVELLLRRVKKEEKLEKAEIQFINAYSKRLDNQTISSKEMDNICNYITEKYGEEIKKLKECDSESLITELNEFKIK